MWVIGTPVPDPQASALARCSRRFFERAADQVGAFRRYLAVVKHSDPAGSLAAVHGELERAQECGQVRLVLRREMNSKSFVIEFDNVEQSPR